MVAMHGYTLGMSKHASPPSRFPEPQPLNFFGRALKQRHTLSAQEYRVAILFSIRHNLTSLNPDPSSFWSGR
jgi:hypothetical protein